ncbi:MFS transporter [Demequina sp. NBRC 110052]|uniref:MFS transporter n=1 Tax=Demequina sp. NBRC 110052 TaxID=1570341 RepID=UPI000A02E567|nr:MFS transporter [Demequina sp. NBRC 110052]
MQLEPAAAHARTARLGVSLAYVAQGLGYATVVTALPQFKDRYALTEDVVALVTLTVVIGAAAGSVLADRIAVRRGSRAALTLAFGTQALMLVAVALPVPFPVFWCAIGAYGIGLGAVDAGAAMQGVLAQRALGRDVMGSFYASATAASALGAIVMSAAVASPAGEGVALAAAAAVALALSLGGTRLLDGSREEGAAEEGSARRRPIPTLGLVLVGLVVFAAFTADSTLSTWTTLYLQDGLGMTGSIAPLGFALAVAPLGYATYQVMTLASRLASDRLVRWWGRAALAGAAAIVGAVGLATMALVPQPVTVFVGIALAGAGVGALVPLAYSAAGDLEPSRSDEIVARVNLFTYPGSVIGAVVPGLLAAQAGYGPSLLVGSVMLLLVLGSLRRFHTPVPVRVRRRVRRDA